MGKGVIFGNSRVMSPSNRSLYITSVGWVISLTFGSVLVTLSLSPRIGYASGLMEPLLITPVSQRCPSFHIDSMLPTFSRHSPYALVRRKLKHDSAIPQLY